VESHLWITWLRERGRLRRAGRRGPAARADDDPGRVLARRPHLRVVIETGIRRGDTRGQPTVERGIEDLRRLREDKLAEEEECKTRLLKCGGESEGLEVTAVMHLSVGWVDERVVRC